MRLLRVPKQQSQAACDLNTDFLTGVESQTYLAENGVKLIEFDLREALNLWLI